MWFNARFLDILIWESKLFKSQIKWGYLGLKDLNLDLIKFVAYIFFYRNNI